MGWWAVGLLPLLLSIPGWALDLDGAIQRNESDTAQIVSTLQRSRAPQVSQARRGARRSLKKISRYKKKKIYYVQFKSAPVKKKS